MLGFLKNVMQSFFDEDVAEPDVDAEEAERREAYRFPLGGRDITVRTDGTVSTMQLRDLSCAGAAGITDLAVPLGGTIFLKMPDGEYRAAEVRWFRNTAMGIKFVRPLDLGAVLRLHLERWDRIADILARRASPAAIPQVANQN